MNANTNFYSLIEPVKANGFEPYLHLRNLFSELPKAQALEEIEAPLRGNLNED